MALEIATVTITAKDKIGGAFVGKTRLAVATSAKKVIDPAGNEFRLGGGSIELSGEGAAMIDVWVPGPGSNPASWQTTFLLDYPDRTERSGRGKASFGPFTIPANVKVTNKALTSNVATLTTGTAHELAVGDKVTVLDVAAPFAGTFVVATVPSSTTFTYAVTNANITSVATTGRLAHDIADLEDEMPVQPEYLATVLETVQEMIDDATDGTGPAITALASRVDGYVDHGNVSGAVTLNGPTGSHWFDATAATTITLAGFSDGQVVSLLCFAGAEDVTVTGLPDLELADGLVVSAIRARGVWVTGGGGGTPAVPDSTPPSAVTTLVATGGEGQVSGAWSAATDAENAVSYRWRVWLTSGGAAGEWTTTTSLSFLKTGLAAGAYTAEVYAYSAGGASATDTATATVTAPVATLLTETFSRTAGPLIDFPIADSGQTWQHNLYGNTITAGGKLQSNSALTTIPIGGVAQEMTLDFFHGGSGDLRVSMGHDGTNTNEPVRQIILTSSGMVSQQMISGEPTYNISGGTNGYTATGQFTLNATHALKVKLTGSTVAVFVDNVKMLEGAANAAAGNYFAFTGSFGSTIDNVVVKG